MPALTQNFQLLKLLAGDPFSTNGQEYTTTDRDTIDRLLYTGTTGHHHNGASAANYSPTVGPYLTVDTASGYLPAGTRVFYEYTYVAPGGLETAPSPVAYVDLPPQVATPAAPTGFFTAGTGSLNVGGYFYVVSAYTGTNNTSETLASPSFYIFVSSVGENTITLPPLPSGAAGFNIYRAAPAESNYLYLASVQEVGVPPTTTYVDNGSVVPNCNRYAPTANTTQNTTNVTVAIPAEPPTGYTWNLYRSLVAGEWANSFLANISTLINGAVQLTFQDLGLNAGVGSPPTSAQLVNSPSKVNLATETQGTLNIGQVNAYPLVLQFSFPGPLVPTLGAFIWVNDFPFAQLFSVRASLGVGYMPASQSVIVDVLKGDGNNPSHTSSTPSLVSIFNGSDFATIPVGATIGGLVVLNGSAVPPDTVKMNQGDSLVVNIKQAGGGATPTDQDLLVNIVVLVSGSALPLVPII